MNSWQKELAVQRRQYHLTTALVLNTGFVIFALADYIGRTWDLWLHFTTGRLAIAAFLALCTWLCHRHWLSPILLAYLVIVSVSLYIIYILLNTPLSEAQGVTFALIIFYILSGYAVIWQWYHSLLIACFVVPAHIFLTLQQMSFSDFIRYSDGLWCVVSPFAVIGIAQYRYRFIKQEIILRLNLLEKSEEIKQQAEELLVQNEMIEQGNRALEDAYRQITDSVNYAKRIQMALLPHLSDLSFYGRERFVLYKPRDIVSGDFFWVASPQSTVQFVAVADCTGHGIPGGFLTVIGQSVLSQLVMHEEYSEPSAILTELDRRLLHLFGQAREADTIIADGMDIILLKIIQEHQQLSFAGAHRPLWHFRDGQLIEYKGSRYPIGDYNLKNKTFPQTTIPYQAGDCVYMFSDGYADQYSPDHQKFMLRRFRNLITEIHTQEMLQQKHHLEIVMEAWKQGAKQTDDWLILGIRL